MSINVLNCEDPRHISLVPQFAEIHSACITHDRMIATFHPPLSLPRMIQWWEARVDEVRAGSRTIVFAEAEEGAVAGVVMLSHPWTETGGFRGSIEKLVVSPNHRQKGVARLMMTKAEEVARAGGQTLILLDTEQGSPAEGVYPKLGYNVVGVIPEYELSPDGTRKAAVFFYKNLLRTT